MFYLEPVTKETAADLHLVELQCCLEDNNMQLIPEDYKQVAKGLTHRAGV